MVHKSDKSEDHELTVCSILKIFPWHWIEEFFKFQEVCKDSWSTGTPALYIIGQNNQPPFIPAQSRGAFRRVGGGGATSHTFS